MWNESSAGLRKLQRAQWRDLNWHLAIFVLVGCFDVLLDLLPLVLHYGNGREMKVSLYISPLCSTLSDRGLKSSPAIQDSVRLLCINLYWPACHLQLLLFSPLYFSLLSCQSSCHLFFVFLSGRNCVRAHFSDKSISRCVYEVRLYSVWLTLKSWCWKAHLCLSFNNAYTPCNANKYDSLFTSYCPWSRSFIDSNILKFQLSFW